jgi:hypothetical protein
VDRRSGWVLSDGLLKAKIEASILKGLGIRVGARVARMGDEAVSPNDPTTRCSELKPEMWIMASRDAGRIEAQCYVLNSLCTLVLGSVPAPSTPTGC